METQAPLQIGNKNALGWLLKHQLAWLAVGTTYGLLAVPEKNFMCLLAFVIAGWICCSALGVLTLPTARSASLILAGGYCGLSLAYLCEFTQTVGIDSTSKLLCLIIGALVGATSRIWAWPLRFASKLKMRFAQC